VAGGQIGYLDSNRSVSRYNLICAKCWWFAKYLLPTLTHTPFLSRWYHGTGIPQSWKCKIINTAIATGSKFVES
jgi:hypothetical protein